MTTAHDPSMQPIAPEQVVPGLFVWLDMKWMDHPFLTNRFLVKTAQDAATIRALGLVGHLYYDPHKSHAQPLPLRGEQPPDPAELARLAAEAEELRLAKLRHEKIRNAKDAAARSERAWEQAASATREALTTLARSPRMAAKHLDELSRQTAAAVMQGPDALLKVLGDKEDKGPQFHALNVMTLCMLLGSRVGLTQRELTDLAMAALAHDAGKSEIPLPILRNGKRRKHEEDHYRLHVMHSVNLARESGAFTRKAVEMIAQHHEALDGSGWPDGVRELSQGAQILAMTNRYDRLCTPESPDVPPLMPSEALAHMLRQEGSRYDPQLLATFIQMLGVYPPGTVVRLSDKSIALVVRPGADLYHPVVLVYKPDSNDANAPLLHLSRTSGLSVVEALRPTSLKPEVLQWLNPQKRLACHFSADPQSDT